MRTIRLNRGSTNKRRGAELACRTAQISRTYTQHVYFKIGFFLNITHINKPQRDLEIQS